MKDIKELYEFNIAKAANGYVIKIEYSAIKADSSWSPREYATLVAKDVTEVTAFIESWFARVAPTV